MRARGKVILFRGEMKDRVHSRHRQSRVSAFGYNVSTIPEGAVIRKMMVTQQRRNCPPFVQGIGTTTHLSIVFLHSSSMACGASGVYNPHVEIRIPASLRTGRGVAEHFRP